MGMPATKPNALPSPPASELARIPGAEPSAKLDAWWWLLVGVIALVLVLVVVRPDPFLRIIIYVRDGIAVTVVTTVVSFLLILVFGLVGGLGRLSKNTVIFGLASLYVELIRGIPLMVQLIWWYFAFPSVLQQVGQSLNLAFLERYRANPIAMAIIGLTICYAAYMSEIYRAGIQSIPKGQMEAARSLGMTYAQSMRHIVLPQAVRVILPPVGNEFIALLKDSSLVSVVAVADLTRRGREFMSTTFIPIETWSMVALLYLILTLFAARMVALIERRTKFER
jgi:polar amino acid transport system permease protein